ncbi:hypothetical protein SAMN06265795_103282 [Noviherbaspirillum humi]|uniref:Transposase DDE domain-containing protein n=1 Tax=Noviherbaspirillum humi TaxID=1688639 RepID=A0A239FBT5_9BURK|nr:hypothetical protein SAMN06265795_103282 [Noviherbaspirillum humi]
MNCGKLCGRYCHPSAAQVAGWTKAIGRPTHPHRHHPLLADRLAMGAAAAGNGMWLGHDLPAPYARLATGRRVGEAASGLARQTASCRAARFFPRHCRQLVGTRRTWRKRLGATRLIGARRGSKHPLIVDGNGTPLNIILTGANRHDSPAHAVAADPAHHRWSAPPAAAQAALCASRPGLRLREVSLLASQAPYCSTTDHAQHPARQSSQGDTLGGRAQLRLTASVPTPASTL